MYQIQFKLVLPLVTSIVFGFNKPILDAQDSVVPEPKLIAPIDGATLDNGRTDRLDIKRWEFEWAAVPKADQYRLKVQRRSGKFPAVDKVLKKTRYAYESTDYVIKRNEQGWTWKVQARVNGQWGNWSKERTFDVERLNTDPATVDDPPSQDIRGTSMIEILVLHQKQNEISFDKSLLVHEPVASYPRYKPGSAFREHLRFSADGKFIAIGGMSPPKSIGKGRTRSSGGGRIELWDVATGQQSILSDDIKTSIDPTEFPVAFSQDSKLLTAADTYGQVKIWDLSNEKFSAPQVIKFKDKDQSSGIATALSFTPDSKRVLVGADQTHQLEIESGNKIALGKNTSSRLLEQPDVINLSPDGTTIALAGLDTGINFFDRNSGEFTDALKQQQLFKQIDFYHFLPRGKLSVVAGQFGWLGGRMAVINDNSIGKITSAIAFGGEFPAVAVSSDGSTLAVSNANIRKSDAFLKWQKEYQNDYQDEVLPTLVSLWRINGAKLKYLGLVNAGNKEMVTAIGLSPDGMTLVTSGASLRFWDVKAIQARQPKKASGDMGVEKPMKPLQVPAARLPIQFRLLMPTQWRTLKLKNAVLTDRQWASLGRLEKLHTLDVSGANFGDEALKHLLNLPELRSLDLSRTKITAEGLKLIKELPETIKIAITSRRNDINSRFSDAVLSKRLPNFYPVLLHVERRVELEPVAEFEMGAKRWSPLRETAVSYDGKWAFLRWFHKDRNTHQQKLVNLVSGKVTNFESWKATRSQTHRFPTERTVEFTSDSKKMIAVCNNKLSIWNLDADENEPPITISDAEWPCSIDVDFKTGKIKLNQPGSIRIYDLSTLKLIKERPSKPDQIEVLASQNDVWSVVGDWPEVGGWHPNDYKLVKKKSGEATGLFPSTREKYNRNTRFRSANIVLDSKLRFKFSGDGQWLFSVSAVKYPRDTLREVSTRVMIHSLTEQSMTAQIDLGSTFRGNIPLTLGQTNDRFATLNRDPVGSFPVVALWKMKGGFPELIGQFRSGHQARFLHFADDDNKVISISPRRIRVWDPRPILK